MSKPQIRFGDPSLDPIELASPNSESEKTALGPWTLGRDPQCQCPIRHEKISKQHAEIWRTDQGQWFLRDLGSTNGTHVNGERLTAPQALNHGDKIAFGPLAAKVFLPQPKPTEPATQPAPQARSPQRSPAPPVETATSGAPAQQPPRRRFRRRNELARLAWGVVIILACFFGALLALRHFDPDQNADQNQSREVADSTPPVRAPQNGSAAPVDEDYLGLDDAPRNGSQNNGSNGNGSQSSSANLNDSLANGVTRAANSNSSSSRAPSNSRHEPAPAAATPTLREGTTRATSDPPRAESTPEPRADAVSPPKRDPIQIALDEGDAGTLFRHLIDKPNSPWKARIQERLQTSGVVILERNGHLSGRGEALLAEALRQECRFMATPKELALIDRLPFPVSAVQRKLRVRYQHDYTTGLGPEVGGTRLAPHPKKIHIEWSEAAEPHRKLFEWEHKTPHIPARELPRNGLDEDETWVQTLSEGLPELAQRIRKDLEKSRK